jgi:hypothetical protein
MTNTKNLRCGTCGGPDDAPRMLEPMVNEFGEYIDPDSTPELCDEPCHD